ncbi:hypothetical protein EDB83DRAFT_2230315, partial [Lactarius deliciosus]
AKQTPPTPVHVRRAEKTCAIKPAHSHHSSLRCMVASNITKFFKAFPGLEEDALTLLLYLQIRIKRYKAIIRMSEEQPSWLEWNVDVLVQLLQIDEPEEVTVIEMVLIQHLGLGRTKVALGILCDQIVPPDDSMEDEDKTIRKRSEALVVAFLAQDPRKPVLAQLQGQRRGAAGQEDAPIDTLIKVLGAISPSMLLRTDALAGRRGEDHRGRSRLPALVQRRTVTRRGTELVLLLLTRAASAPREDLPPGRNPASLEQSRGYPELSDLLCHAKGAVDLAQLLRFYCTSSLMGKMMLGRLSQDSRAFFVAHLAGALAACDRQKSPESSELASMRRQVVDALNVILPVRTAVITVPSLAHLPKQFFIQVAPSDVQAWGSCEILLQTCQQVGGP